MSMPAVLRVIGDLLVNVDEEMPELLAPKLAHLQRDVPSDMLQTAFGKLSPEAQDCVNAVMKQYVQQVGTVVRDSLNLGLVVQKIVLHTWD
jgi:hypothetical protein